VELLGRRGEHLARRKDAGAHLLRGQRASPAGVRIDQDQGRDEGGMAAVQLQRDGAPPRQTGDVRRAQPDILHDGCVALRVVRQVELCWQIRGAPSARFIPRNHGELVRQRHELRLPDTPVVPGAVHEHERRLFADALVSDRETACADKLHGFTLSPHYRAPSRVTGSARSLVGRPDETSELDETGGAEPFSRVAPYRARNASSGCLLALASR
jgi:hypothetical protein